MKKNTVCFPRQEISFERDKYKKTLEEIRDFLNTQKDQFGNYVYHIDEVGANKILNKINEVLDE